MKKYQKQKYPFVQITTIYHSKNPTWEVCWGTSDDKCWVRWYVVFEDALALATAIAKVYYPTFYNERQSMPSPK